MKKTVSVSIILLTLLILMVFSPGAYADRGGFSLTTNAERVSETSQKAIIAWNGTTEVLVLSTDVNSSAESEVLEIMPLPSNPTISKGETSSFLKIQELVNSYFALSATTRFTFMRSQNSGSDIQDSPQISMVFQERIGAHFLTVIKAEEADVLLQWLEDFLHSQKYTANLPSSLSGLLTNYTQNEINFFVIDLIMTNSTVRTVDPLIYEFNSSRLYYPLSISNLFSGDSDISIFTVTSNELKQDSILGGEFVRRSQFQIGTDTVNKISPNMTALFSGDPYVCYFSFKGALDSLKQDVSGEFQTGLDTPTIAWATLNLSWGLILTIASFTWKKRPSSGHPQVRIARWQRVFLLLTGVLGVAMVCTGFFLPWGLVQIEELLLPASGAQATAQFGGFVQTLFLLLPLALLLSVIYLILAGGDSSKASATTAFAGALAILFVLLSCASFHTLGLGAVVTLTGYFFGVLAGSLSFWCVKMEPTGFSAIGRRARLAEYLIRRILMGVVTLIGITWVIFLINYILPPLQMKGI